MSYVIDHKTAGNLLPALERLAGRREELALDGEGTVVSFAQVEGSGLCLVRIKDGVIIRYHHPREAFRALGILLGGEDWGDELVEASPFSTVASMVDLSRNGVLTVSAWEHQIERLALMGFGTLLLYMEDVYTVDGEPFFGYARGAYSKEELRHIDAYGALFGIEVIPCVQTLGHLEQIFQWPEYQSMHDVATVLLVGEERSYELIARILDTMSQCFRSKRLHIGMDEAHGLARGVYQDRNGHRRSFDVFNEHLSRVYAMCVERGLRPMIWSDMYFRMGSVTHDYYDPQVKLTPDIYEAIPQGVEMVYWDYYHTDPEFYKTYIDRHCEMGKEPILAVGAWTWGRFWAHYPHAFATMSAGLSAARDKGLKEVAITQWGDDATECLPYSALPALQYFAELAYRGEVDEGLAARRFFGSCGGDWTRCLMSSDLDAYPGLQKPEESIANFSKWIFWHDPVLNFLDLHIPETIPQHYAELKEALVRGEELLEEEFVRELAATLSGKSHLHLSVKPLYQAGDLAGLRILRDDVLPGVIDGAERLNALHRQIWLESYKPFGWEILERRYAGLIARLKYLDFLLERYLADPAVRIEEFEVPSQRIYALEDYSNMYFIYPRTASSTVAN